MDWICGRLYETWFSLVVKVCVIGGIVVSAGAIAEMGWEKALFNCTGVWDKDVALIRLLLQS